MIVDERIQFEVFEHGDPRSAGPSHTTMKHQVASALVFNSVCLAVHTADIRALSLMHALFLRALIVSKAEQVTPAQQYPRCT